MNTVSMIDTYSAACRYYLVDLLFLAGNIDDYATSEKFDKREESLAKYNKIWGSKLLLMDGKTFRGGISGMEYEKIINLLMNFWDA